MAFWIELTANSLEVFPTLQYSNTPLLQSLLLIFLSTFVPPPQYFVPSADVLPTN